MLLKVRKEVEVPLTVQDLADGFWRMASDEQAEFFNILARDIPVALFAMQMRYLTDEKTLTVGARGIMRLIGEYSVED